MNQEAPLLPGFNLEPTFFGFDAEYRITLHENIFNLIWHGEGRWDWDTIYNMPVHLRRYWIKRVNGILKDREEAVKERIEAVKKKRSQPPNLRR